MKAIPIENRDVPDHLRAVPVSPIPRWNSITSVSSRQDVAKKMGGAFAFGFILFILKLLVAQQRSYRYSSINYNLN